ncbi:MAG: hypothetical protein IKO05_01220 [Selenomonadaceae bacterium]|nr:hypothetical protein [Selenomonadaceae bacterium]
MRTRKSLAAGVAGRLGHSNTLITQNLYTHNTLKLQKETVAIFAENLQTRRRQQTQQSRILKDFIGRKIFEVD